MGLQEIIVILIVAVLIWGGRLPQVARKAAGYYVRIRRYLTEVRDEVMKYIPEDVTDIPADPDEPSGTEQAAPTEPPSVPDPEPAPPPPGRKKARKRRKRPSGEKKKRAPRKGRKKRKQRS